MMYIGGRTTARKSRKAFAALCARPSLWRESLLLLMTPHSSANIRRHTKSSRSASMESLKGVVLGVFSSMGTEGMWIAKLGEYVVYALLSANLLAYIYERRPSGVGTGLFWLYIGHTLSYSAHPMISIRLYSSDSQSTHTL